MSVEQQTDIENIHRSIIVRYWYGPDGELRGHLLIPATQKTVMFTSQAGLHETLSQIIQASPRSANVSENEK